MWPPVGVTRWNVPEQKGPASRAATYSGRAHNSRNLIFHLGGHMDLLFQAMVDRSRARLNMKSLKTIFGRKGRPHRDRTGKAARLEVVVETPAYDLTILSCTLAS